MISKLFLPELSPSGEDNIPHFPFDFKAKSVILKNLLIMTMYYVNNVMSINKPEHVTEAVPGTTFHHIWCISLLRSLNLEYAGFLS